MFELKISQEMSVKILDKINESLSRAIRIKGNYSRQNDILRVWNNFGEIVFTIVATSGRGFGHNSDMLEIKSTGLTNDSTMSLLVLDNRIHESRFESKPSSSDSDINEFISSFLQSEPDYDLTLKRITAEGHNKNDLIYPK
jgi:hypothetical protein